MNANIGVLQSKMMELQTETDPNKKAAIQSEIVAFAGKMTGAVKEARKGALPPLQAEGKQYSPEDYQFAANIVARYPKQEAAKMYASGKWTAEKFDAYLEADAALKARERKIRNKVTEQIMGQE